MEMIILNDYWPEYRTEAPLIPDLMHLVMSYLIQCVKTKTHEFTLINGFYNGVYRKYYDSNGQLFVERHYKYGKRNGMQRIWYTNGQLWQEQNYKNDKTDGPIRIWCGDGELRYESPIINTWT